MPFGQTRTILEAARACHRRRRDFYRRLAELPALEPQRLLFEHLSAHQERLDTDLGAYQASASRTVLDTWYSYPPEDPEDTLPDPAQIAPFTTMDEVVALIEQLDHRVFWLYEEAARRGGTHEVRELFARLLETERHEHLRLVRHTIWRY